MISEKPNSYAHNAIVFLSFIVPKGGWYNNAGALYPIPYSNHIPVPTVRLSKENMFLYHREAYAFNSRT